jgi:phosphoribosylglycinamide formyltransferase-1
MNTRVKKLRVGVLASGSGTDLQSIIDTSEKNMINAQVVVVVSDKSNAFALERAKTHSIPGFCINPKGNDKAAHEQEIDAILSKHQVELVVGAGYMRILSSDFVRKWHGKLINIHPALLPSFKGTNGARDALAYGVKISGCTTHFMDEEMDHGPIILQAAVKVLPGDDRDSLAERILAVEHQVLPRTVQLFAQKRLRIENRKVVIAPGVLYSEG